MICKHAFAFLLFLCCSLTTFGQQADSVDEGQVQANVTGSGTANYLSKWTTSTNLANSALYQNSSGNIGIATTAPGQKLEVDSGNFLVKGSNNFKLAGQTAFAYVGDVNHSVEAIYSGGLAFGVYKIPEAVYIADKTGWVGIGTQKPSFLLTLVEGGGAAIADAWDVYSSRRFKTDIHPLLGALEKVEQLQGVSFIRKSDQKPEIGVVAEDVAQVVPEVVSHDPKTGEVQGVDYSRLSAILIEAVKAQQTEIEELKTQIRELASKK